MARMGQNLLKELRRGNQFYDQNMFIISGHTSFNSQNPRHMFQTSSLNDSGIQDKLQPEQKLLALYKSGAQPGFVVVLEHIPAHAKFDKEAREQLLDVFREAAEFWAERKVAFRCFYSFSVARAAAGERAADVAEAHGIDLGDGEKMPTDKLVDVSPLALRMSSPFNAGYWLTAA